LQHQGFGVLPADQVFAVVGGRLYDRAFFFPDNEAGWVVKGENLSNICGFTILSL
jgi:hypothetical protein